MVRLGISALLLLAIIFVEGYVQFVAPLPAWSRYIAYTTVFSALILAILRGGLESYVFWITLIAAYPLTAPLISQDIFGYDYFAPYARLWQSPQYISHPLLLGGIATLFLANSLSSASVHVPRASAYERVTKRSDIFIWVTFASLGMVAFAVLGDPTFTLVGSEKYGDIVAERLGEARFAAGAWIAFGVLAMALYIQSLGIRLNNAQRFIFNSIFVLGFVLSMLWMLAHARRVEPIGMMVLLLCTLSNRIGPVARALSALALLLILAVIGYIRNLHTVAFLLQRDYVPLPGGAENVFIGFVSAISLIDTGGFNFLYGESYLGHILRLPPAFLGFERPAQAYDHIREFVRLQGGEFYLVEPFINFSAIGIVGYLIAFVLVVNWSIASMRTFIDGRDTVVRFAVAAMFFGMIFRTLWYGLGAVIKGEIIMLLISTAFCLVLAGYCNRRYFPRKLVSSDGGVGVHGASS